jgi:hypothetical protein
MNLKELLGDQFREDLTVAEVLEITSKMNLVDLEKGEYVSLKKFQDREKELQTLKADKTTLAKQLEEIKTEGLTEVEKLKLALQEKDTAIKQVQLDNNKAKVVNMFTAKGLTETEYADYIDQIVSEDFEKSQKLANGIISTIDNKLKETNAKILDLETKLTGKGGEPKGNDNLEGAIGSKAAQEINAKYALK